MSNDKTLTLEQLQGNLRRLAERLDYGMDECALGDSLEFDAVSSILFDLSNGRSGDEIADMLDLPVEYCDFDDEYGLDEPEDDEEEV